MQKQYDINTSYLVCYSSARFWKMVKLHPGKFTCISKSTETDFFL